MMEREQAVTTIAKTVLGVETLESQHRDSMDFHDIAVWKLRAALEAAFEAGQQAAAGRAAKVKR